MLILAAISITMLTGDNGILNKAVLAKEATRGGEVQETVNLAATHNTGVDYTGGTKQTREEVIEQLHANGKLTDSEVTTLEENDIIVIGGITIDFSVLGGNNWVYDHTTQTVTKGKLKLKIGDRVKGYTAPAETTYTGDWRVLGVENGKLLIVTETAYVPIIREEGVNGPYAWLIISGGTSTGVIDAYGVEGGIAKLNEIGESYVNPNLADSGRSINVEDINTITGYDPANCYQNPISLDKGPYGSGYPYQYGNSVTYTVESDGVSYTSNIATGTNASGKYTRIKKFIPYRGTELEVGSSSEPIESTTFCYNIENLGQGWPTSSVPEANRASLGGVASDTPAYDMIANCVQDVPYWLASPCVSCGSGSATWTLFNVVPGGLVREAITLSDILWGSVTGAHSLYRGVRPVVTLKSNVKLIPGETDEKGITNFTIQV